MAPRKTQNGASATTRRTPAKGGARASSSARTPKSSPRRKSAPASAKRGETCKAPERRWWLVPAIAITVVGLFVWSYYPVARVQYRETRERARLQSELDTLKQRNARLRKQVDRLKTPEGVEDYARTQLGLVKRGENVVVVVDGSKPSGTTTRVASAAPRIDSDEIADAPAGPWTALLDAVFGVQ